MSQASDWTTTWRNAYDAELGRQWMYEGTAREVAEAKGWKILETRPDDMVLAQKSEGELIAIGALPRGAGFGFWSVAISA